MNNNNNNIPTATQVNDPPISFNVDNFFKTLKEFISEENNKVYYYKRDIINMKKDIAKMSLDNKRFELIYNGYIKEGYNHEKSLDLTMKLESRSLKLKQDIEDFENGKIFKYFVCFGTGVFTGLFISKL